MVAALPSIGLADLGSATLFDRVDAKFIVHRTLLGDWLDRCASTYHALEVNGSREGRYRTTYFDSADMSLYRAHLTGRAVRRKLRVRSYLDSGASFLELKCRDRSGRTTKSRVPVGNNHASALEVLHALPSAFMQGLTDVPLHAVLSTKFTRVTLVDTLHAERVTIDAGITFQSEQGGRVFPSLVCIEVKQERRGKSSALAALHALRQRSTAFSKYCIAVACVVPGVPTHRFKPILQQLQRIERDATP